MMRLEIVMSLRAASLLMFLAVGFVPVITAQPPAPPNDFFIRAEQTDLDLQLKVTWKDFPDEDLYQLIGSNDSSPGPFLEGEAGNITLGSSWELIADLEPNTTEFVHNTVFSWTYALCAFKGFEVTCLGRTNFVTPKFPPEPATVDSLQVSQRTTTSLRLQWTQSSNTVFSRARIRRQGSSNVISTVENDPNQSVVFSNLPSNVTFTLEVCVRSAEQDSDDLTCRTVNASTLPQIPLAPSSISVDQDDPVPTQRTVFFTYNNQQSSAVAGISMRIIKDDQIVAEHTIRPQTFDTREHRHTFTGLAPFTGYEAWVVPFNAGGIGTAAGIGFTTPTRINLALQPLSGDSAMLRLVNADVGEYTIQGRSGTLWLPLGRIRQTQKGEARAVVPGLSGSKEIRVLWKLAYLRSETTGTALPLAAGAPELISVTGTPVIVPGGMARLQTRYTVTFRTTSPGRARYVLQRRNLQGWAEVSNTGIQNFGDDDVLTLQDTTQLNTGYRVCRSVLIGRPRGTVCSETSAWATGGIRRLGLRRVPRGVPNIRVIR